MSLDGTPTADTNPAVEADPATQTSHDVRKKQTLTREELEAQLRTQSGMNFFGAGSLDS